MIKIKIPNIPPYKQSPASNKEKETQKIRKTIFQEEAKQEMINKKILSGDIKLKIRYKRGKCKSDSANIIGGICDSLSKIVYNDDSQVKQIDYKETKSNKEKIEVDVILL